MRNYFENTLKLIVFAVGILITFFLFKLEPSWWLAFLFSYNFILIGGYILMGGIASIGFLVFIIIIYIITFMRVLAAKMSVAPFFVELLISITVYYLIKKSSDINKYYIFTMEDKLKILEGEFNSLIVEEKNLRIGHEANIEKLNKYKKLKEIYETTKDVKVFSDKIRKILASTVHIFHKEKSVSLFLIKENRFMKVVSDGKEDMFVGEKDKESLYLKNFDEWVINNKKSLIISDIYKDVRFTSEESENIKSLISVPLSLSEKLIGILRVTSENLNGFSHEDVRFLDIIAAMIGRILAEEKYAE